MCFLRRISSFPLAYDGRKRIFSFRNAMVIYDMRVTYGHPDLHENLVGKKKKKKNGRAGGESGNF